MIHAHVRGSKHEHEEADAAIVAAADRAFRRWLRWWIEVDPIVVSAERPIVDSEGGFGGTHDAILRIGRNLVLADWKTGKDVYDDVTIQLGAYRWLWDRSGDEPISHAIIVNVPTVDDKPVQLVDVSLDQLSAGWRAFDGLLWLYKNRSALALRRVVQE